jgi:hypothetical protein
MTWFKPTPPPPEPEYGSVRISPSGDASFVVERYEISDRDMRRRGGGASWYAKCEPTTVEACEVIARQILREVAESEEAHRLKNEKTMAHHAANPPRIVTLED